MYADLLSGENEKEESVAILNPSQNGTKSAGLIPSAWKQESQKSETPATVYKQTPDFKIKVSEEKDSIPN